MEDADSVAAKAAAPITGQAKGKPRGQRRREPVERCDSPPPPQQRPTEPSERNLMRR